MGPDEDDLIDDGQETGTPETEAVSREVELRSDVEAAFDKVAGAENEDGNQNDKAAADDKKSAAERARDEQGRFVRQPAAAAGKSAKGGPAQTAAAPAATPTEVNPDQQQAVTAAAIPPADWSPQSKAAWDQLPEHVRADVARSYQAAADGMRWAAELRPHIDLCAQHGRHLPEVFAAYYNMEQMLRSNPVRGMHEIARNAGLTPQQVVQMFGGGTASAQPGQAPAAPDDPLAEFVRPIIKPLEGQLSQVTNLVTNLLQQQQSQQLQSAEAVVADFASSPEHKYFANVQNVIKRLLDTDAVPRTGDLRRDLATAYEQACYLVPEVRDALINERVTATTAERQAKEKQIAAQAKQAARSITGSTPGNAVRTRPQRRHGVSREIDIRSDVEAAFDDVMGRA